VRYCASPGYVARCGEPAAPQDLAVHECIVVGHEDEVARWPFRGARGKGVQGVAIGARLRTSSFAMSLACARAGLGIAIAPEFACQADLDAGRLVSVLESHRVRVGSVWLLHPTRPFLTPRVRAFIALAREHFSAVPFAARRPVRAQPGGASLQGSGPGSPPPAATVKRARK
jgi:DNA-binding transcriptional LysR family regulator